MSLDALQIESSYIHLHWWYSVLFALPLGCLLWWWPGRNKASVSHLYIVHACSGAGWLFQHSYIFSPAMLMEGFSSISPKLNLCSSSTANKGTTWPRRHIVAPNQYAYEDLYWWLKIPPLRFDWRKHSHWIEHQKYDLTYFSSLQRTLQVMVFGLWEIYMVAANHTDTLL